MCSVQCAVCSVECAVCGVQCAVCSTLMDCLASLVSRGAISQLLYILRRHLDRGGKVLALAVCRVLLADRMGTALHHTQGVSHNS